VDQRQLSRRLIKDTSGTRPGGLFLEVRFESNLVQPFCRHPSLADNVDETGIHWVDLMATEHRKEGQNVIL